MAGIFTDITNAFAWTSTSSTYGNNASLGIQGSVYKKTNTSYSGCDITVTASIGQLTPVQVGNVSTISYSIHREKYPVRALGFTSPKAICRGPRTIAGTIVFSVFDRYALYNIAKMKAPLDKALGENAYSILGDQMLPFDLTLTFANEMGVSSILRLYQVEFVDEGQTSSVNDIYTESIHSFMARDIDVMFPSSLGPMTDTRPYLSEGVVNSFTAGVSLNTFNAITGR